MTRPQAPRRRTTTAAFRCAPFPSGATSRTGARQSRTRDGRGPSGSSRPSSRTFKLTSAPGGSGFTTRGRVRVSPSGHLYGTAVEVPAEFEQPAGIVVEVGRNPAAQRGRSPSGLERADRRLPMRLPHQGQVVGDCRVQAAHFGEDKQVVEPRSGRGALRSRCGAAAGGQSRLTSGTHSRDSM